MIRVLQMTDGMGVGGGIQSFIMNVYRNLDHSKIQFDFLLHRHNNPSFDNEIIDLGGSVFYVPGRKEGLLKNINGLNTFFEEHPNYDAVHFHASSLSYIEPLIAAKKANIPVRIMHAHSSQIIGSHKNIHIVLHKINQQRIHSIATHYLSCGELASQWMYGSRISSEKINIITNGIDLHRYAFSIDVRERTRIELGLENNFVMCHIGRFEEVKNHIFLVEVFEEVLKSRDDAVLLLIGKGSLFQNIKDLVDSKGLSEKVYFMGIRNDINALLMASDCFVLPSIYEGFPVVAIEAQATGIPVFMSDTITKDASLKSNSKRLGLEQGPLVWAQEIISPLDRIEDNTILFKNGLDLSTSINSLCEIYCKEQ